MGKRAHRHQIVGLSLGISYEIALRLMPQDLTDDKSKFVQVMAWCHQAASHYLSQCWPRSMLPNGVTRPQWVNTLRLTQNGFHVEDDIFRCISLNWNSWISNKLSSTYAILSLTDNEPALVQVLARHRTGHYLDRSWPKSIMPYGVTRPRVMLNYLRIKKKIFTIYFLYHISKAMMWHIVENFPPQRQSPIYPA